MTEKKYTSKTTKYDQFIDLKKLPLNSDNITLNHCKVIFDEQGFEHIKGLNSLKIKASKIYATQKALAILYDPNIKLPKCKITNNYIETIDRKSRL
jgi:hypothetical protein